MTLRPLASSSVLLIGIVYGFLLSIADGAGLFGIWLALLLWLSIGRYAYTVLHALARGKRWIPGPGIETMNPIGDWRCVAHFVLFGAALVLLVTTRFFGSGFGGDLIRWTGIAALLAVFPASAALMSITGAPAVAVSWSSILEVVRTMGADYVKLLLALLAMVCLIAILPAVIGGGILAAVFLNVFSTWALFAMFALIGGALHEYREEFDIPGVRQDADEIRAQDRARDWSKTLDRAYASIRGGLPAEGYRTIKELLASENNSVEIHQWVFNRMLEWEDRSHALELARRFIERLVEGGHELGALDLVAQCRRLQHDFAAPPVAAARLAEYARTIGRHGMADELAALSPHAPHP